MTTPSFYSDPNIQYLHQILEDLETGQLQIPRFQRPLVWDADKRLELLRSVCDGIPCGAFMVWRTENKISCYSHIGPFKLPPPKPGGTWQYLMDGVQRLSTLHAALHEPDVVDDSEDSDATEEGLAFYYDLKSKEFLAASQTENNSSMLPLRILLDSVALLRFQRQLPEEASEEWIRRADALAKAFRLYKIPIIPIVTESLEMATRTLQLLNRQGERMSDLHMVHTLTFSEEFDLLNKIEELREEIFRPLGWAEINEDWILKALEAYFDLDLGKPNTKRLSDHLREMPDTLDQVAGQLESAIRFLRHECGVPSPYMVPYAYHVFLLAEAFRIAPEPTEEVRVLLKSWFWLTTVGGSFAGISGYRLSRVARDIYEMVENGKPEWSFVKDFAYSPLPSKVDFKAVRIKGLALRLADRLDSDQDKLGQELLIRDKNRALAHLLPADQVSKSTYSSPGNRVLADVGTLGALRAGLFSGENAPEEVWDTHLISAHARDRLNTSPDAFIQQRVADLEDDERQFIRPHAERFNVTID